MLGINIKDDITQGEIKSRVIFNVIHVYNRLIIEIPPILERIKVNYLSYEYNYYVTIYNSMKKIEI